MLLITLQLADLPWLYLSLALSSISFVYFVVVCPLFLHPLCKIPRAHWSVAYPYIGDLWILYQRYRSRPNVTTYKAHQKYGEVVRLGYNELSVNCIDDGIRTVYGGGWDKHDWYARRSICYGVINMFLTVHRAPHSQKKRTVANVFSKSYIQNSAQLNSNSTSLVADRILPLIQSFAKSGEEVEIHDYNTAIAMDFMTAYLFGISHSTNFIQDLQARQDIMHQFHLRHVNEIQQSEISPRAHRWFKTLHINLIPGTVSEALHYLETWNARMCYSAAQYISRHPEDDEVNNPGDTPVVYSNFTSNMTRFRQKEPNYGREFLPHITALSQASLQPNDAAELSLAETQAEMFDYIEAGGDGTVLTNLHWVLACRPLLQERLYEELSKLGPRIVWTRSTKEDFCLPDPKALDALPLLDAIITETLRLYSSTPGAQPRISPDIPGGSRLGQYSGIPANVRVSAMPYALHRNPDVFPDPEIFDPERWLTSDSAMLKEMKRWYWAFGSGGRMCIGNHFAMHELKIVIATIYASWTTVVVDDSGVEGKDGYAASPRGKGLVLKFIQRN